MTHEQTGPAIREGSYGMVAASKDIARKQEYAVKAPRESVVSRIFGRSKKGVAGSVDAGNAGALIATQIVEGGVFDPTLVDHLPNGDNPQDVLDQAELIAVIGNLYGRQVQEISRSGGEKPAYSLGLKLSDFIELIDAKLAARLLISATQPQVAQDGIELGRRAGYIGEDSQVLAVEAAVLLPRESRRAIFREMISLDHRPGRGLAFFKQIAANLYTQSEVSAARLIQANLKGEQALEKIQEVSKDLQEFGPLFRGEIPLASSKTA